MNRPAILISSLIITIFIMESCTTKCDCDPYMDPDLVSEYELKKSVISTNSTNFATGFESVFANAKSGSFADSAYAAQLCQAIIEPVRFFTDESGYFFVESYNAWMVAHATKPELIGTYRYNITDINGKYYVHGMVEAVKYKGYGFVDYYFENPTTGLDTKKLAFVKSIPAVEFFIGTGFYDYVPEKYYVNEEVAMKIVENATKSMAYGLSGGFSMIADSMEKVLFCRQFIDHIRFFDNQSGYFFIYDFNCVNVAHGTQKDLQGQNLYNYQDSKGNYVIRDLVAIAEGSGSGYYQYYWNNPITGSEDAKEAYIERIPGTTYFIGSGIYYEQ